MTSLNEIRFQYASILQTFAISGNVVLVVGNTAGNRNPGSPNFGFTGDLTLATMDISSGAASPVLLKNVNTGIQVNGAFNSAGFANGVFALVANAPVSDYLGPPTLYVVDARTPSNPVLYPVQSQFGFGSMIATSIGYLLVPNSLGLNIYLLNYQ